MKYRTAVLMILICGALVSLLGEDLNIYQFIHIKTIPAGAAEGLIGWNASYRLAGGYPGPATFVISAKDEIYIPDRINKRINVYDLSLNFLRTINDPESRSYFALTMKIDDNDNIVSLLVGEGLTKINQNGQQKFLIPWGELPDQVGGARNYFPIGNEVFYYNDDREVEVITERGEMETKEKAVAEMKNLTREHADESFVTTAGGDRIMSLPLEATAKIDAIRDSATGILIGDALYNGNLIKTIEYGEMLSEAIGRNNRTNQRNEGIELDLKKFGRTLVGYDKYHNGYWRLEEIRTPANFVAKRMQAVAVYSKYGELLDAFYCGEIENNKYVYDHYPTTGAFVSVSSAGDVYFMLGDNDGHHFWKVYRRW